MSKDLSSDFPRYEESIARALLAAREAVMAPIRPHLRAAGVTEQQWRVLRVLADATWLDASGISRNALLYPPSVTRILKDLLDRKLVAKQVDAEDGRRLIISITEEGRKLVHDTAERTRVLLNEYRTAFGAKRFENLRDEAAALANCLAKFAPED